MAKPGGVCWSGSAELVRRAHGKGSKNNRRPPQERETFEAASLAVAPILRSASLGANEMRLTSVPAQY